MLILTIKTDQPTAEIGIYKNTQVLAYEKWEAHRQLSTTILVKIQNLLGQSGKNWNDLQGIVFFKGPGSFTGLRIGAAVVNALAVDNSCLVAGENGEEWIGNGIARLLAGESEITVIPEYGSEPRTTKPKK